MLAALRHRNFALLWLGAAVLLAIAGLLYVAGGAGPPLPSSCRRAGNGTGIRLSAISAAPSPYGRRGPAS